MFVHFIEFNINIQTGDTVTINKKSAYESVTELDNSKKRKRMQAPSEAGAKKSKQLDVIELE